MCACVRVCMEVFRGEVKKVNSRPVFGVLIQLWDCESVYMFMGFGKC